MSSVNDAYNRKLIETDTSTNFFVEAGAGSGKTTELVSRMLAMVENGIDVSEICAITFTKAAANEFYDRFQKKLIDVVKVTGSEMAKEALKNIDLCFMGTIDSFTNMIISEHPTDALVPADASVVDNTELHELWKAQLALIADGDYGQSLQDKYKLFTKFSRNSEAYFIAGLDFLLSTKNVKFEYAKPPAGNFNDIFADEVRDIKEALEFLVGSSIRVLNDKKGDRRAVYFAKIALGLMDNYEDNYDAIMRLLNKLTGDSGLRFDKSVDLDNYPGAPNYIKALFYQSETKKGAPSFWKIKKASEEDNPFYKKEFDNYAYSVAMDFISACVEPISSALKIQGKLSFSDYLFYLKEMLKNDAQNGGKLINHIYGRHKYFMIDEFQDTDPVQAEVFFYLSASNLDNVKTWKDCIPRPGSLFIVGDPKQSIYRFRNADVASYLNVKKLFENEKVGKVLYLTKNFRSYKPMCSWFNDTFSKMLQHKDGIQSEYVDIPLEDKKEYTASLSGATKQVYINGSLKKSAATGNLVTIISELVNNEKYTVEDPPRKIDYKDIMVITYRKAHLKFYMDALRRANIPYWVEGNVLFDDCPALTSLSAILNLIACPQDAKAKAGVKFLVPDQMTEELAYDYKHRASKMPAVALVSSIIDEQKLIAQCGTKNIEYLYYALELLRDREVSGEIITLHEAAKFIEGLASGDTDEERCLQFATDDNRVHLANLHKVKGLQASVVVMTEAKMSNHDPQKHVDYMSDEPHSCMFELAGEGFGAKIVNWNNATEKQLEAEILEAEKDRLLYVAATRAQSAFIATEYKLKSGGVPADNQAVNLLENISDEIAIGDGQDEAGNIIVENPRMAKKAQPINDRAQVEELYTKAKNDCCVDEAKHKSTYEVKHPSKAEHINIAQSDASVRENKIDAAFIGTIVHRLMEFIVTARDFHGNHEQFIDQVMDEFDVTEPSHIEALKKAATEASEVLAMLEGASEIYCEVPFCYKQDSRTLSDGVMDLVYCKEGAWHIIDYKTNYDDRYLDIKYENQLNEYKAALKQILNIEATAEIFHIAV